MPTHGAIRSIFSRLLAALTAPAGAGHFVCGDCERWERCGRPPSDDCIVKAAQLARDEERPRRRFWLPAC
jgi:hypothetical protein